MSSGTCEYTLNKEDVGRQLTFVYVPVNLEGLPFALLFHNSWSNIINLVAVKIIGNLI